MQTKRNRTYLIFYRGKACLRIFETKIQTIIRIKKYLVNYFTLILICLELQLI